MHRGQERHRILPFAVVAASRRRTSRSATTIMIAAASVAATELIRMSRFFTCASSCAITPVELVVVEQLQDALGRRHRRVLRVPAGRERIRRRLRDDVDLRHRQPAALGQVGDDVVQSGDRDRPPSRRYIARTILSENQYEPKFMTTAKTKPRTRPCAPPSASPRNRNSALIAPSSSAVFKPFGIVLFYQTRS